MSVVTMKRLLYVVRQSQSFDDGSRLPKHIAALTIGYIICFEMNRLLFEARSTTRTKLEEAKPSIVALQHRSTNVSPSARHGPVASSGTWADPWFICLPPGFALIAVVAHLI